ERPAVAAAVDHPRPVHDHLDGAVRDPELHAAPAGEPAGRLGRGRAVRRRGRRRPAVAAAPVTGTRLRRAVFAPEGRPDVARGGTARPRRRPPPGRAPRPRRAPGWPGRSTGRSGRPPRPAAAGGSPSPPRPCPPPRTGRRPPAGIRGTAGRSPPSPAG